MVTISPMRYVGIEALLKEWKSRGIRNDLRVNSKNFPPQPGEVGEKLLSWKLFPSVKGGQFQYERQVVESMAEEGHRPATVQELIHWGNENPGVRKLVVALGQDWLDDERWHVYVFGAIRINGYGGGIGYEETGLVQLLGVKEEAQ